MIKSFKKFIIEGVNPKPVKMNASLRKKAKEALSKCVKDIYYREIPITEICAELKKVGVVVLQEDYTEWSGMLIGAQSHATLTLGDGSKGIPAHWDMKETIYPAFDNAALAIQWYKDVKRKDMKYEINAYIS